MSETLAQTWLSLQCQMIPNLRRAYAVLDMAGDRALTATAHWPAECRDPGELAAAVQLAISSGGAVMGTAAAGTENGAGRLVHIACPLMIGGRLCGTVAVEVDSLPEQQERIVVQLLKWGGSWLDFLLSREPAPDTGGVAIFIESLAASLEHERFPAAATELVTALARILDCQRVSLGLLAGKHNRLRALSHSVNFDRKTNLLRDIERVMDEACAQDAALVYPPLEGARNSTPPSAHAQLAQQEHQEALCALPLVAHGHIIGALCCERAGQRPFDAATMARLTGIAALLGPIIELKRKDDRWLIAKIKDALHDHLSRLAGPRHVAAKTAAAALTVALLLSFGSGDYRITADATLEGTVQRALVAPIDGYIGSASVRAGALVKAGDVLASLDDKELRLEQRRWTSQRDERTNQYGRALGKFDRAEAKILHTQVAQADAQLDLVNEQLARTRIVAPFDGIVVSGDLSQSLGAPVERGQLLFEVAPLDAYRIMLDVDEAELMNVRVGSRGSLALAALAERPFPLIVDKITGVAEAQDGRNVFRVEARLEEPMKYLRPGMKGVAKIEAGRHKLIWIWTHTLLDRLRLWLWSWLP